MEKSLTARSFIVRICRVDTEDHRKITGMVEFLDGSGRQKPFRDIDELAEVLNGRTAWGEFLHAGSQIRSTTEARDLASRTPPAANTAALLRKKGTDNNGGGRQ